MKVTQTELPGVHVIEPVVFADHRGSFVEIYREDSYAALGLPRFVQENESCSRARVLRGLHYQLQRPQAKLVRVLQGEIWDVAVDIRRSSPMFGKFVAVTLSAANRRQMFIPAGFAHGFCVLSDEAEVLYKCSDYYSGPADQLGVAWDDPGLAIPWPFDAPILSEKDRAFPTLSAALDLLPL